VAAKSLAEGAGYRILSLPDQPHQTKYPPLLSFALSLVWRINPRFPENLQIAAAAGFLLLMIYVWLCHRLFRSWDLGWRVSALLCTLVALNPYLAYFSVTIMADLPLAILTAVTVLLAERASRAESRAEWAVAAGIAGAAAYLVKSAALPLVAAAALYLVLRRQWAKAAVFSALTLCAVAGWMGWAASHRTGGTGPVEAYYTDYLRWQLENVTRANFTQVLTRNFDDLFSGISDLLVFKISASYWGKHVARLLTLLAVFGVIRLTRRTGTGLFAVFGAMYASMLLVWHYPPDERFLLPLYPLLTAGVACELGHLCGLIQSAWKRGVLSHKFVAAMLALAAIWLVSFGAWTNTRALTRFLPGLMEGSRRELAGKRAVYEWIGQNVPADATFLAYGDPVLYLYTGRRGCSMRVPPRYTYAEDLNGILKIMASLDEFAARYQLGYVLVTPSDFSLDPLQKDQLRVVRERLSDERLFALLHREHSGAVHQVLAPASAAR
jgi:hypothetical protein